MDDNSTRRAIQQRLVSLQAWGVTHIPSADQLSLHENGSSDAAVEATVEQQTADSSVFESHVDNRSGASGDTVMAGDSPADAQSCLDIIRREVAACTACRELASTRKQTVFGVGNPHARLCFLGEAPGADEDRKGEPFVGRAGQLLTKIIEACTLRREDVYILNILKCRPPGNRNPLPSEVDNCSEFLRRQLDVIQPEYICCLGSVAATNLLDTKQTIGRLRGRFHLYQDIKVLVTYHPAYLLRNPSAKREVWKDMKILMREMGVEVPT